MKKVKPDHRDIEAEVQKTLQGFEQVEKVKAKPFFFTRLQHRLDLVLAQKNTPAASSMLAPILRPAWAPLLIVISIGVGILIGYKSAPISRNTAASVLVEAYGLNAPDLTEYTLGVE
ncbi:MAG TPA: hypothetical protein VII11_11360 [Bacteroidota bacterium]